MDEQNQHSGGAPETQQRGGDAGGGSGAPGRGALELGMTDRGGGRLDGVGTGSDPGAGRGGIAQGGMADSGGSDRDASGGDAGASSNH